MIHLPASVRVYLCLTACDMRKSFDSLQALVGEHLDRDPFAGHLFVFASRSRDPERSCTGTATGLPSGASAWNKGRTQRRSATEKEAAANLRLRS